MLLRASHVRSINYVVEVLKNVSLSMDCLFFEGLFLLCLGVQEWKNTHYEFVHLIITILIIFLNALYR